ncbi:MAG: hypothetical protein Q9177_005031 [Variospora cf. flavescens]
MLLFRILLIYVACFISLIAAVADYTKPEHQTKTLQVLWKETQDRCVTMELDKFYQFRQKDVARVTSHARLVVGHIWKDDVDDDNERWDFRAWWFAMAYVQRRPYDHIWGGKCVTRNVEWECREADVYKFAGEVEMHEFDDIVDVVGAEADTLTFKNDCYNLATNNCQTFAKNLARRMKKKPPVTAPPAAPITQPFDMKPRFPID